MPRCLLLTARVVPIGTPDRSAGARLGEADIWLCRVLKPSRETRAWDRTPLGPKTASLVRRALRWQGGNRRGAGIFSYSKIPALHRAAERDTTGSNLPSALRSYVDWPARASEASPGGNTPLYSQKGR